MFRRNVNSEVASLKRNLRQQVQAFLARMDKRTVAMAAVLSALVLTLGYAPVSHAQSFNIDMSGLMNSASDIFNGLWPAFAVIAGLSLGFVILQFVLRAIRGAFGG